MKKIAIFALVAALFALSVPSAFAQCCNTPPQGQFVCEFCTQNPVVVYEPTSRGGVVSGEEVAADGGCCAQKNTTEVGWMNRCDRSVVVLYFMEDLSKSKSDWDPNILPMAPWTISQRLKEQSEKDACLIKVFPSQTAIAEHYRVREFPTLVFLDRYGNEYTRIVKRMPADQIVGAIDAFEMWNKKVTAEYEKEFERFQKYEKCEDESRRDRKAALNALAKIVNNRNGHTGMPVIEAAKNEMETLVDEGLNELRALVDGCTAETLDEVVAKIGKLASVYGVSKDFETSATEAIKTCKETYAS